MTQSALVEDTLRRLRTLLRFQQCYVEDVRSMLEDLATREIAAALVNDSHLRRIHGEPALVAKIEALEGELETARAQIEKDDRTLPRTRPAPRTFLPPVPKPPPIAPAPSVMAPAATGGRTVCSKGHPMTPDNVRPHRGKGGTVCRTCHREYMRDWMRKKAAKDRAAAQAEQPP